MGRSGLANTVRLMMSALWTNTPVALLRLVENHCHIKSPMSRKIGKNFSAERNICVKITLMIPIITSGLSSDHTIPSAWAR